MAPFASIMSAAAALSLLHLCDPALAVNIVSNRRAADPKWNGTSIQENRTYSGDYPKDENNVAVPRPQANSGSNSTHDAHSGSSSAHSHTGHAAPPAAAQESPGGGEEDGFGSGVSFSPEVTHSAQWYMDQCTQINLRCEARREAVERAQASEIHDLEGRYKRRSESLDHAEDDAEDAAHAAAKQEAEAKKVRMTVEAARATYAETKECPAQLKRLNEELREMEADPNDSEEDIDAECQKRKEILEKERCVDSFVEAEITLSRRETSYSSAKEELSEDEKAAQRAEEKVAPRDARADSAKEALDDARSSKHVSEVLGRIDEECEGEVERLRKLVNEEVSQAEAAYRRHQLMLDSKEEERQGLKHDVQDQKARVRTEKMEVEEARTIVSEKKECRSELEKAEQELEQLEATENGSDEDIDAECQKKKEILAKRRCVDKYLAAKDVLARTETKYSVERQELEEDRHAAGTAKTVVEGYEGTVHDFKEAWEASRAARAALRECSVGGSTGSGRPNGAGIARPNIAALLIGSLLAIALLRA